MFSQHNLAMDTAAGTAKNPAEAFADKRGADFDREYADAMVDAHQNLALSGGGPRDLGDLGGGGTAIGADQDSSLCGGHVSRVGVAMTRR